MCLHTCLKGTGKENRFWVLFLPTTWTLTFKPTALEHCVEHAPVQYYNHQLMCASNLAAISTIVCQVGVFEHNLKSYSERDQIWLTATSTSMNRSVVCLMTASLEVIGGSSKPQTGREFIIDTQKMCDLFSLHLQPIDALKWQLPLRARSKCGGWVSKNWHQNKRKETTTWVQEYWPVILPRGNRISEEPARKHVDIMHWVRYLLHKRKIFNNCFRNRKNNSPHSQTLALNYIYIIMQIHMINNNPGRLNKCMCRNKIVLTTTVCSILCYTNVAHRSHNSSTREVTDVSML